jgi:ankyrin repeat protein
MPKDAPSGTCAAALPRVRCAAEDFIMRLLLLAALIIGITIPAMGEDDFLKAVNSGDLATVQSMLARDPALANARNAKGTSAVISALFINQGEGFLDPAKNAILQALLAHKPHFDIFETAALGTAADLDAMLTDADAVKRRTHFGWTLLHMSAFGGNAATTELLLKKGAAIDARAGSHFRNTPLQTALLSNQYATAKILLEHGADALVRQSKGFTPMHEGALSGRIDIIQLLLDHGAEINSVADNGQTPLAEAMRGKHEDVVAWMKTKGAVVGIQPFDEDGKK